MSEQKTPLSLKRSLAISTVLHLLVAPLFVTSLAVFVGVGIEFAPGGSEQSSPVMTITFERRSAHAAPAPKRSAAALPRSIQRPPELTARASKRKVAPRSAVVVKVALRDIEPSKPAPLAPAVSVRAAIVAAPRAAEQTVSEPVQTPAPVPPTTPSPTAVAAVAPQNVTNRVYDASVGGWGQSFENPILPDDSALNDLRAKFHSSLAVSILIDENGRALKVSLPGSLSGDERAEVEHRLSELRYVPAECNGLRCTGTLKILI